MLPSNRCGLLKGITMKFKGCVLVMLLCMLFACGGGGSSNDSGNNNPTPSQNPNINQIPAPPSNDIPGRLQVQYTGLRSAAVIDEDNAGQLAITLLESLDLLNVMVIGDGYSRIQYFDNTSDLAVSEVQNCSSGNIYFQTNSNNTLSRTSYLECKMDDTTIDGSFVAFSESTGNIQVSVINIDVNFDFDDGTSVSMRGHVYSDSVDNYTYNLIITGDGETYFFDELVVVLNRLDGFEMSNNGDIYVGSLGKVNVVTSDITYDNTTGRNTYTLEFSGTKTLELVVDSQNSLSVEAEFLDIPLMLDLVGFQGLPDTNLAPNLVIQQSAKVSYEQIIQLDLSNSFDPNLDVISYSFIEGASPDNSSFILNETAPSVFSVAVTRPGIYELEVTATDNSGLATTSTLNIEFARKKPSGMISLIKNDFLLSETVEGELNITNDPFDGPFSANLAYGPEGMKLINNQIIWDPKLPNLGSDIEVHFGIRVENADDSVLIQHSFIAHPDTSPVVTPITVGEAFGFETSSNTNIPQLIIDELTFDLILNDDKTLALEPSSVVSGIPTSQSQILGIGDYNDDGKTDVIFYQFDEKQNKTKIMLHTQNDSENEHEIVNYTSNVSAALRASSVVVGEFADTPGLEFYIIDSSDDFIKPLLTSNGELLDSQVDRYKSPDSLFCDVNEDGVIDWISTVDFFGYRLSGTTENVRITGLGAYEVPLDPVVSGLYADCNIVFRKYSGPVYSPLEYIYGQIDIKSPGDAVLFDYGAEYTAFINRPDENFVRFPQIADINNNGQTDFYVSIPQKGDEQGYLLIFEDVFTDDFSTRVLMFDENTPDNLSFSDLKDIDNDGVLEHLSANYEDGVNIITVSKLLDTTIESYVSKEQSGAYNSLFSSWYADKVVSEYPADLTNQEVIGLTGFIDVRFEQGTTVTYSKDFETKQVTKATATGQELWGFTDPWEFEKFQPISDDLLLTERFVYNRVTGEPIFELPANQTLQKNYTPTPLTLSVDDKVYFFASYGEGVHSARYLTAYQIDNEFTVEEVDVPLIDIAPSTLSAPMFTGKANDLALFFAKTKRNGFEYEKVGLRLDLATQTIQEFQMNFFEDESFNPRLGGILSLCYKNSESCTTQIYVKTAYDNSARTGLYGIDGVTGFKVWETLDYIPQYQDISIIETPEGLITILETNNNIYKFE